MSADTYYIIRKAPGGKFVALCAFSSDVAYPDVPDDLRGYELFDDPRDALVWASRQESEYGATLHPECGDLKISKSKS